MKTNLFNQLIIFLNIILFLSACSKNKTSEFVEGSIWEKSLDDKKTPIRGEIYSNRPITYDSEILMLELSEPSLLNSLKKEDGKLIIDQDKKAKLLLEQENMITKIKEIDDSAFVIFRYHYSLNALAVLVKKDKLKDIQAIAGVVKVEKTTQMQRPETLQVNTQEVEKAFTKTTVEFIGAHKVHQQIVGDQTNTGIGIKVGVIDSGVDFTHKMLGGSGAEADYKAVDASSESDQFPNDKIIGGIDLVGTAYHGGHGDFDMRIPKPDKNPMDEAGHGTHVAGTIAGIGDGIKSYSGVAPDAKLHAIKVFGKNGSTDTYVIIQAFEYAIDPNADFKLDDKLDVLNLSLGSSNGHPHSLYQKAISSLELAKVSVVASAGNSGDQSYIVGSPSTSASALSVAAGVDNMDHNVGFPTINVKLEDEKEIFPVMVEGQFTKSIKDVKTAGGILSQELVHIGTANVDLTDEQKKALKGKIALIDRGEVTFVEKVKRAEEGGAVAVVMVNNVAGDPIIMGGELKTELPGVMITLAQGDLIKEAMKNNPVVANLDSDKIHTRMELVDNLTSFSSRGPRSVDSIIKPEIAAPGQQIISAEFGGGDKTTRMSGTSMSAPHMSGVMALMIQKYPEMSIKELKAMLIGTAKSMQDSKQNVYPVSYQGGGRVQVDKAANASFLSLPATISLGNHSLVKKKMIRKTLILKNITDQDLTLSSKVVRTKGMEIKVKESVSIKAKSSAKVKVNIILDQNQDGPYSEREGVLAFESGDTQITIPLLAVVSQVSKIGIDSLKVYASDETDAEGAAVDLTLTNKSGHAGDALIFNLIGVDERRSVTSDQAPTRVGQCDLQSAGYRIVEDEESGKTMLEIAAKTYMAQTTWSKCEISVLIDGDGDKKADQELAGIKANTLPGLALFSDFYSILLDVEKVKKIRMDYELNSKKDPTLSVSHNYMPAIEDAQPFKVYNQSTLTILRADVSKLRTNNVGMLNFKLATLSYDGAINESDDFLNTQEQWVEINSEELDTSFREIPTVVKLEGGESTTVEMTKGALNHDLVVYFPQNLTSSSSSKEDKQSSVVKPVYTFE